MIPVRQADSAIDAELKQLDGVYGAERCIRVNLLRVTTMRHDRQSSQVARLVFHLAIDWPVVRVETLAAKNQFIAQVEQQVAVSRAAIFLPVDDRIAVALDDRPRAQPAQLRRVQLLHESGVGSSRLVVGQQRGELYVLGGHHFEDRVLVLRVSARNVQVQIAAKIPKPRDVSGFRDRQFNLVCFTRADLECLRLWRELKPLPNFEA